MNVVSAYVSQVGCQNRKGNSGVRGMKCLDCVPRRERVVIEADVSGHVQYWCLLIVTSLSHNFMVCLISFIPL